MKQQLKRYVLIPPSSFWALTLNWKTSSKFKAVRLDVHYLCLRSKFGGIGACCILCRIWNVGNDTRPANVCYPQFWCLEYSKLQSLKDGGSDT